VQEARAQPAAPRPAKALPAQARQWAQSVAALSRVAGRCSHALPPSRRDCRPTATPYRPSTISSASNSSTRIDKRARSSASLAN